MTQDNDDRIRDREDNRQLEKKYGTPSGYWQCPYCYKQYRNEFKVCCGEQGHLEPAE